MLMLYLLLLFSFFLVDGDFVVAVVCGGVSFVAVAVALAVEVAVVAVVAVVVVVAAGDV